MGCVCVRVFVHLEPAGIIPGAMGNVKKELDSINGEENCHNAYSQEGGTRYLCPGKQHTDAMETLTGSFQLRGSGGNVMDICTRE